MKTCHSELYDEVKEILEKKPQARKNDNYLVADVWTRHYGTCALLALPNNHIAYETITRTRRKIFEDFPSLNPKMKGRKEQEEAIKELARS